MKVKIYVEGGGQGNHSSPLRAELRQGFQSLFIKAGFGGKLPSVVASGSRNDAFKDFETAIGRAKADEIILLLVDSEDAITKSTKWEHVKQRDSWDKPQNASENNLFFMVECMESWFLADKDALKMFYGQNFHDNALPIKANLESISKENIYKTLEKATKDTTKGVYAKGAHSFKILATLDPIKVREHGSFAREFFEYLEKLK